MAQNVKFIKGNTAKINSTAIADGQLLYNTTTGQHYIDNESTRVEVGKPVVNTIAEVSAITVDNIPCGTKPVKELNESLSSVSTIINNRTSDLSGGTVTTTPAATSDLKSVIKRNHEAQLIIHGTVGSHSLPAGEIHFNTSIKPSGDTYVPLYIMNGTSSRIQLALINTDGNIIPSTQINAYEEFLIRAKYDCV